MGILSATMIRNESIDSIMDLHDDGEFSNWYVPFCIHYLQCCVCCSLYVEHEPIPLVQLLLIQVVK